MRDEVLAHLHDILSAARSIKGFISSHTLEDYTTDEMLRSAVERKFEIMGEALNRIKRDDPETLAMIRDHRDIVSFRNILVHGYDAIDDRIVWDLMGTDLDNLIEDVERLLQSKGE